MSRGRAPISWTERRQKHDTIAVEYIINKHLMIRSVSREYSLTVNDNIWESFYASLNSPSL